MARKNTGKKEVTAPKAPPERLAIFAIEDGFFFPHGETKKIVRAGPASMVKRFIKDKFAAVLHVPKGSSLPIIGTLLRFVQSEYSDERGYTLSVIPEVRIKISNVKKISSVSENYLECSWTKMEGTPISPDALEEMAEMRMMLSSLCNDFVQAIEAKLTEHIQEHGEDLKTQEVQRYLQIGYTLVDAIRTAEAESFGTNLDKVADIILSLLVLTKSKLRQEVSMGLRGILFTIEPVNRIRHLIGFTMWLMENFERIIAEERQTSISIAEELSLSRPLLLPPPSLTLPADTEIFSRLVDPAQVSVFKKSVLDFLGREVISQERAHEQIARKLAHLKIGRRDSSLPVIGGLFFGPSGVGKTSSIEALAEFLFGDKEGLTYIPCHMLKEHHQSSCLIGAPPGFVGYSEEPWFSQWRLDRPHVMKLLKERFRDRAEELGRILEEVRRVESLLATGTRSRMQTQDKGAHYSSLEELTGWNPGKHISIVLLDELEEAHPDILLLFLRVLDNGTLHLMDGEIVKFCNTIFFATSNLYGREIANELSGKVWGIRAQKTGEYLAENLQHKLYDGTVAAAQKFFPPKLLGRFGKENIRVFHSLGADKLLRIVEEKELPRLVAYAKESYGITLFISAAVRIFIIEEASDQINRSLGARALQHIIRQKIEEPLAVLLDLGETDGVARGDEVYIDVEEIDGKKKVTFKTPPRSST